MLATLEESQENDFLKSRRRKQSSAVDLSKLDRLPPHSIEAEQGVLGCILLDPLPSIRICLDKLKRGAETFYDLRHQMLYDKLVGMYEKKEPVDLITITQDLRNTKQLEAVGGVAYLSSLMDAVPSAVNLTYYLDIIREKFKLRRIISSFTQTVSNVYEFEGEVDKFIAQVATEVKDIEREDQLQQRRSMKELVHAVINRMEEYHQRQGQIIGVPTGLADLDRITCGLEPADFVVIAARPSCGKAQPLDCKVLTPAGFIRMGDIEVGQEVIGRDGRPHTVLGVFPQGKKPVYSVKFSDRTETKCCAEHLWFTQTRNERRRGLAGSVKNTLEIKSTINRADGGIRNHAVPCVEPVVFDGKSNLPLHPWLLGALLGDACLSGGNILFSKPEPDVQQKLIDLLPESDTATVVGMNVRIKRKVKNNTCSEVKRVIVELGLAVDSEFKFIPKAYLHASPSERLEILRGLLDTDGFVNRTNVEFTTSSPQLMEDVAFIVRSLGGVCRISSRIPKYTYKGLKRDGLRNYRANIWFEDPSIVPVSSDKQLHALRLECRHVHKSIVSVEEIGVEECQCILIDGDEHLYVTDDFIVTHNTSLAMNVAANLSLNLRQASGVFSLEMTSEALVMRLACEQANVPLYKIRKGLCSETDLRNINVAAARLIDAPFHIDDSAGITIRQLRARACDMKEQHDIKVLVVDYLQLVKPTAPNKDKRFEFAEVSEGLKALAKELEIPVIALAQLNRDVEKRKEEKPKISDIRECGNIEQDADIILLLSKSEDGGSVVNCHVAKQRNGPTCDVQLLFNKETFQFRNLSPIDDNDIPQ